MNTKHYVQIATLAAACATPAIAEESGGWFVRPYVGLSQMSDISANVDGVSGITGETDISVSTGFNAGLGVGYRYNDKLAVEIAWEYRSNDSETDLAGQQQYEDGNYASNSLFLNGHYFFNPLRKWQPYIGAGLSWIQEVDIDLERDGQELSYSGDGDIGYQVFAGANYRLQDSWTLQAEIRYGSVTGIDLSGEEDATGDFSGLDYEPVTIQFGVVYAF